MEEEGEDADGEGDDYEEEDYLDEFRHGVGNRNKFEGKNSTVEGKIWDMDCYHLQHCLTA